MKIAFMGTPEFGAIILEALAQRHEILAVVTKPDKKQGRGGKIVDSPVKFIAKKYNYRLLQPSSARDPQFLTDLGSVDIIVTAAYGKILPRAVLERPRYGCLNVHGSLLPKYRGAAPVQWALINGEAETGITFMRMDTGVDTGDIIFKKAVAVNPTDDCGSLMNRLGITAAYCINDVLKKIVSGEAAYAKQDDDQATYAPAITGETACIDWSQPARRIANLARAMSPEPGATAGLFKIWKAEAIADLDGGTPHNIELPGEIITVRKDGALVNTASGILLVTELQAPGGKRMRATDYFRGHKPVTGMFQTM
ncbi:MAG: methionyl-tRNA formyltransferase [Clostridiales bacterium]|jgi:methionyl-tRNA formyltransferase|nr:methionyl-tRNA formyltransferase [Clostridiales bacterium]